MDVFDLRRGLIEDYREYVSSFIRIRDDRIREKVDSWFNQGRLWPDPMVGLNPTFATGGSVDDLVADGTLHSFERSSTPPSSTSTALSTKTWTTSWRRSRS